MASITNWSRLEPRVRNDNLDRSLQAQIRDPLWMLTRQWQFGEFLGEDAGSLIKSQMTVEHRPLTHYGSDQDLLTPLDGNLPLETRVEREPITMDVLTRVQAGLHFARLLVREGASGAQTTFLEEIPISAEGDFERAVLDEATKRFLASVSGRVIDGGVVLAAAANGDDLGASFADVNVKLAVRRAAQAMLDWFNLTYSQTLGRRDGAWNPPQLEYRFSSASAGDPAVSGVVLKASEYSGGHLDWYSFDIEGALPAGDNERQTIRLMPSPVTYRGMPSSRWWEFEEGLTDFGRIDTHTTDLGRLLLAEFGLIYGDDWFIIPYDAPVGTIVQVSSLVVTDVCGQHFLVQSAKQGGGQASQHSRMFALSSNKPEASEMFLFLPPSLGQMAQGPPIEEVVFMRDEMANMAWGVEKP